MSKRAELRRQAKENGKKAVYQYTQEQIDSMIAAKLYDVRKEVSEEVVNKVLDDYLSLTLMVLYDKFDFDKDALVKFKKCMDNLSDSVNENYVEIEDLKLTLIEELDINLLSLQESDPNIEFEKLSRHKKRIVNSGCWIMYVAVMLKLKELYKFGNKRSTLLTQNIVESLKEYFKDPKAFDSDFNKFGDTKDFKECIITMKKLLHENNDEVISDEEI